MKCTRCGAEVEAQRFCIYCGERLLSHGMTARPVRTPSGVMRFRHRASVSQSSLPQPKRTSKLELESLKSLSAVPAESASRQSRELEALLAKLNGHDSSCEADVVDAPAEGLASLTSLDVDLDEDLGAMDSLVSVDSMNDALSGDASYVGDESLDESFFLRTGGQTDVSGPVPMGSGTFSRAPSGGFMLVLESMRSAVRRAVDRLKSTGTKLRAGRKDGRAAVTSRRRMVGGVVAAVLLTGGLVAFLAHDGESGTQEAPVVSAQTAAGNEDFSIVALDEVGAGVTADQDVAQVVFDPEEFSIPALESDDGFAMGADVETEEKDADATETVVKPLREHRMYDRRDNVLATASAGTGMKLSRGCVMREGPSSRFGLIKALPAGARIEILSETDEDWVLEKGGLWKKSGMTKLGPGAQFADAETGMKVPGAPSRVISSSQWRYIKYGEEFGYVGPACFKK